MGAKSPVMMSELGVGGASGFGAGDDLGFLLKEQRSDREREIHVLRSGSAPPTIEGSLSAVAGLNGGGFRSEEELRADPAYLSYYYSHENLNPRLPPPVLTKEDWRSTQRLGGIGDGRKSGGGGSLFSRQPEIKGQEENGGGEWTSGGGDGLIGLSLGRQKSFAEMLQDETGRKAPTPDYLSRPSSRNALDRSFETYHTLNPEITSAMMHQGRNVHNMAGTQNKSSQTFASVLASSVSRNSTPDPQQFSKSPSPALPNAGVQFGSNDSSHSFNGEQSDVVRDDLLAALSGMKLSSVSSGGISQAEFKDIDFRRNFSPDTRSSQNPLHPVRSNVSHIPNSTRSHPDSTMRSNIQAELQRPIVGSSSYLETPFLHSVASPGSSLTNYLTLTNHVGTGNLPPLFENAAAASAFAALGMDSRSLGGGVSPGRSLNGSSELLSPNRNRNQSAATAALQMQLADAHYIQRLKNAEYAVQAASMGHPLMERGYMGSSYLDLLGIPEGNLGALHLQKLYGSQFPGKTGPSSPGYFGSPLTSPVGPGSPARRFEPSPRFHPGLGNYPGGSMSSWNPSLERSSDDSFPSTLLDEFKSTKTRCFELSDIASHVVEFSSDQYGSRFIQQKLEAATTEEKDMVFEEIMPQALSLMTDVFGNYVVQKFFEHGSAAQIRELANQLNGRVLALSLQMYGCRVIQKAIEVVGLDQQTKMVAELDGHIMRCVRDQNGNHVIQKCIECIPQEAIYFVISSFFGHVVALSTHPYGCRVIQRVLEHCDDPTTQQSVMDEIMPCVCMLAQDQYGNYVVQHVLEHGKPHERSEIIKQLAGQIVKMSQQKFASNVVEKCLTFGGPAERQILVNEMLGSTDENEPLQAMMKDQFANYVVQKVLETCDDRQRELILSRIKVHLNALKRYTYGKHIVARVEKLVAAGERRIGLQSSYQP